MVAPAVLTDDGLAPKDVEALWLAYRQVFSDTDSKEEFLSRIWVPHSTREGFRVVRATDGEVVVGFAYGYVGRFGQWWTDNAGLVLPADVADEWLDGHFEVVTLGVTPSSRRRGLGRVLLRALVAGWRGRLLLMTAADPVGPARLLYESEGWRVIGRGIAESQVIMGKRTDGPEG